ncbi:MAG: hypothetical protein GF416_03245 [Candidatus Altiarchaeales archaeon]|nr:hypothetical protein [Candidatus Altiarchaeales archaeon]MBD3416135.1 hypothetical protein [Candidatus Altiarchaeales archaeon]
MAGESEINWNWPAEQIDRRPPKRRESKMRQIGKVVLFFIDEAIILVVLGYILYRIFT